ncbi:putative transport protein HsrA [Photorhabdus australis subsp. thailandensis]|uniref:Putative transport protein HsrA n=1 Tax=Photorhabdus australis subsp. thailandensis TaxID=2805096 RepID=A0A1C0U2U2_9GAMM|nr:MFS transporter [Photorhabdus australis]OCQ52238.1 putative transport protein HsrA [Photorhabdus australis subsp. thailandensis]
MTYRYRIAFIFLAGFFIDCVNIFMSAIALPDIARELNISESSVTWVANSYILGITLIIPLSTWLASYFGAKLTMAASMAIFTVGALLSGLSSDFASLILFRFIQGVGGGLLIPVGQALTFELFKKNERAKISTLIMAVALTAPAISPGAGGVIVDHLSWRWVFLCNIPFSLITALLAFLWIKEEKTTARRPDLMGLLLVSLALANLLLGMSLYANATSRWLPFALAGAGIIFSLLYIRHARSVVHPILDLSVLHNKRMSFSVLAYYAVPGIFTGVNLLNIFYLQQILGWSASETGLLMVLYAGGSFCAMMACGRLYNRIGAARLFFAGFMVHAVGIALLSLIGAEHGLPLLLAAYLLMGTGGGIAANTAQITAMLDFEGERLARASTVWNLNRQMSFSIGAAFFTLIFNLLQQQTTTTSAYHYSFLIAAGLGFLPLLKLIQFSQKTESLCNQKKN